jgi:VanZ family protein
VPAGLAFSAAIETVQLALPGRYPTVQDVAANTVGALLGAATVVGWRAWRRRHPPDHS